jgi:putative hydrolase of the HAD superfamily
VFTRRLRFAVIVKLQERWEHHMRRVDAVIFDFGGVLTEPVMPMIDRVAIPGLPSSAVRELLMGDYGQVGSQHPWHRLERGEITLHEYKRLTRQAAMRLGSTGDELPFLSGSELPLAMVRDSMIDLVKRVRRAGLKTAILTNNIREFRDWRDLVNADSLVDIVVDSCEVGMRKPDRRIFDLTLDRLGVAADRAAFLDDMPVNVEGAERAGLIGVLVPSDERYAIAAVEYLAALREPEWTCAPA